MKTKDKAGTGSNGMEINKRDGVSVLSPFRIVCIREIPLGTFILKKGGEFSYVVRLLEPR